MIRLLELLPARFIQIGAGMDVGVVQRGGRNRMLLSGPTRPDNTQIEFLLHLKERQLGQPPNCLEYTLPPILLPDCSSTPDDVPKLCHPERSRGTSQMRHTSPK